MNEVQNFFSQVDSDIERAHTKKALRHLEKRSRSFLKRIEGDVNVSTDLKQSVKSHYKNTVIKIHNKTKVLKK